MSHDLLVVIGQSSSDLQPTGFVTFSPRLCVCCVKKERVVAMLELQNIWLVPGEGALASNNDRGALRATSLPLMSSCYP